MKSASSAAPVAAPLIDPKGDSLLRIREVAGYLRSSDKTVRRLITEGKIRSIKVRGIRLIRASELVALVAASTS
jgi:excisionase family DNA binding protein